MACSDGELQFETVDFDQAQLEYCGSPTIQTELFFKLNERDALILELQSGLLKNEVSADTLRSEIPGQSQLYYRFLSDEVTTAYFCNDVPPVNPKVVEEVPAEGGTVQIFTTKNPSDTTQFEHNILLKGVSFVNKEGERLTNIAVENFGTLVTTSN